MSLPRAPVITNKLTLLQTIDGAQCRQQVTYIRTRFIPNGQNISDLLLNYSTPVEPLNASDSGRSTNTSPGFYAYHERQSASDVNFSSSVQQLLQRIETLLEQKSKLYLNPKQQKLQETIAYQLLDETRTLLNKNLDRSELFPISTFSPASSTYYSVSPIASLLAKTFSDSSFPSKAERCDQELNELQQELEQAQQQCQALMKKQESINVTQERIDHLLKETQQLASNEMCKNCVDLTKELKRKMKGLIEIHRQQEVGMEEMKNRIQAIRENMESDPLITQFSLRSSTISASLPNSVSQSTFTSVTSNSSKFKNVSKEPQVFESRHMAGMDRSTALNHTEN